MPYDEFGNLIDGRTTGMQGYMLFRGSQDDGAASGALKFMTPPPFRQGGSRQPADLVFVPIRAWGSQLTRRFTDVTSSVHYEPTTDMVYSAAIPTGVNLEIRAEGVFHIDIIPSTLMIGLFSGSEPSRVILGIDNQTPYFEGDCLVSNFIASSPVDGVVTYQCSIRPYGSFTFFPDPSGFGG